MPPSFSKGGSSSAVRAMEVRREQEAAAKAQMAAQMALMQSKTTGAVTKETKNKKVPTYRQGDRCIVQGKKAGVVQFVGEVESLGSGTWIGIQLDDAVGNSNGRVGPRRYFDCPNKHGIWVRGYELAFEASSSDVEDDDPPAQPPPMQRMSSIDRMMRGLPPEEPSIAEEEPEELPPPPVSAAKSSAAGRGLEVAVVNQLAQFVITAHDANGERRQEGGDAFSVFIHGVKPPQKVSVKLHDEGNGTYIVEYRPRVTGELEVQVSLDGQPLPKSPFTVQVVILRPEPNMCVLKGNGLTEAVARKPMSFQIEFADALGQPAYAEDLDVRIERIEPLPSATSGTGAAAADPQTEVLDKAALEERMQGVGRLRLHLKKATGLESADLNGKSDPYAVMVCGQHEFKSTVKPKALSPTWNEDFEISGDTLREIIAAGLEIKLFDCDNPLRPDKDASLGEVKLSLGGLQQQDCLEFTEPLPTKGKVSLSVTWQPPAREEDAGAKFVPGDERVVIGSKPLLMRSGFSKDSAEKLKLLPGTRLQLHEIRETDDGFRAHVRVLSLPTQKVQTEEEKLQKESDTSPIPYFVKPTSRTKTSRAKTSRAKTSRPGGSGSQEGAGMIGWVTAAHKDGRRRLAKRHLKVEANERRRDMSLWDRRTADDRKLASKTAEQKQKAPSYAHELADCKRGIAFAYGGVFPGTLHAKGVLHKTHDVNYSIGAAGTYLMHVGLRQLSAILPGSPFVLQVKPGPAHAQSTALPQELLPLESIVGTGGKLSLQLRDGLGNACIEGDAPLQVAINQKVTAKCEDQDDGTYLISWGGKESGVFSMSVTLQGVHVRGSPASLTMHAAELFIEKCELSSSEKAAVAGVPERLQIVCRDTFGNDAEPEEKLTFGVLLLAFPSNEKPKGSPNEKSKGASDGDGEKKSSTSKMNTKERDNLLRTQPSVEFEGSWKLLGPNNEKSTYTLTYVPREAGDFEMHVWCDTEGNGTRNWLPDLPKHLHVKPGRESASGSFVRDAHSPPALTAGDRLVLKAQMRDEWGNNAPLSRPEDLVATLSTPSGPEHTLVVKEVVPAAAERQGFAGSKIKSQTGVQTIAEGAYELVGPSELTVKGEHVAHITLDGHAIQGSPITFSVQPAAPIAAKSRLQLRGKEATVNRPCELVLQLVDKYGNEVERGEVRVDAKAFGSKTSECQVQDNGDGTYAIKFTAGVAGDYKVQVRLENIEMEPMMVHAADAEDIDEPPPPSPAASVDEPLPPEFYEPPDGYDPPEDEQLRRQELGLPPLSPRQLELHANTARNQQMAIERAPSPDGETGRAPKGRRASFAEQPGLAPKERRASFVEPGGLEGVKEASATKPPPPEKSTGKPSSGKGGARKATGKADGAAPKKGKKSTKGTAIKSARAGERPPAWDLLTQTASA